MTLAEACTYPHDGWPFPFLFPAIFLAILLATRPWRRRRHCGPSGQSVLADRFARGEIDEDEYRARSAVLRHSRSRGRCGPAEGDVASQP